MQLPRAARVVTRRRARGDGPRRDRRRASTLEGVTHAAAAFDHAKLDWMNGEWIRRLTLAAARGASPAARRSDGSATASTSRSSARRCASARSARSRSVVARDRPTSSSSTDDEFAIDPESWERLVATDRVAEVLDAGRSPTSRHASGRRTGSSCLGQLKAAGFKARKVMPALYAAIEGRAARVCRCSTRSCCSVASGRWRGWPPLAHAAAESACRTAMSWLTWRLVRRVCSSSASSCVGYYVVTLFRCGGPPTATTDRADRRRSSCSARRSTTAGRTDVFRARLDHAADALARQGVAPTIVVTGGKQPGDRFTEAGGGRRLPPRARGARRRDPARDDESQLVGVVAPRRRASCRRAA